MQLLSAGFRKLGFLGTSAFFFLVVEEERLQGAVQRGTRPDRRPLAPG